MNASNSSFKSFEGTHLKYYNWLIEKPTGTLIVFHGMSEHGGRYENFAHCLNANGYDLYALDFRGHGKNIGETLGYFSEKDGWQTVVNDLKTFIDHVFEKSTSKNVTLLGHSMGSLLLRSYLIRFYDKRIKRIVLTGTPAAPPAILLSMVTILVRLMNVLGNKRKPLYFMDRLIFGKYSKFIRNPDTPFDWLSRDKGSVQRYIEDPLCGFVCTGSFFKDLFYGMKYCNLPSNIAKIDSTKNILILSGSQDPVGDFGKAPHALRELLSGVRNNGNIGIKIYEGYRHEILNEVDNIMVYEDILEFLKS